MPLVEAYGMTEAAHQMASNPLPPGERRAGSVGVAHRYHELTIMPDGEVAVRGPGVVDGYRDNPEANAAAFQDGWFRTGDSGMLDSDGYLHLAGRIKELINRGGEKIAPTRSRKCCCAIHRCARRSRSRCPTPSTARWSVRSSWRIGEADQPVLAAHCAERLASFKVPTRICSWTRSPRGRPARSSAALAEQIGAG